MVDLFHYFGFGQSKAWELSGLALFFAANAFVLYLFGYQVVSRLHKKSGLPKFKALAVYLLVALQVACFTYARFVEPFHLRTEHYTAPLEKLKEGQEFRVAHLSDLHADRAIEGLLIEAADAIVKNQPDIIVMTGDYLGSGENAVTVLSGFLKALPADVPIFAVWGRADEMHQAKLREIFAERGVTLLENEKATTPTKNVDTVFLYGIDPDQFEPPKLMGFSMPALCLHHQPNGLQHAAHVGYDAYFSGYTHGGQVRLPLWGSLATFSSMGKKYDYGMYKLKGHNIFVSAGLGTAGEWAPRLRFLCPPTVTFVDMVPAGEVLEK